MSVGSHSMPPTIRRFDMRALSAALDEERRARGLTWTQLTDAIDEPFHFVPSRPISASTIGGMADKQSVTSAVVLQILRWLGRSPESFLQGRNAAADPEESLPGISPREEPLHGPAHRLSPRDGAYPVARPPGLRLRARSRPMTRAASGSASVGIALMLAAARVTAGAAQQPARAVIDTLPVISFEEQCTPDGECDRAVEDRVFAALDSLGSAVLGQNASMQDVRRTWGEPPTRYLEPLEFRDVRFGNRVSIWTYAVSLSGTVHYVLVFANGCLDFFGTAQAGALYARYGRPGWSSETVERYRFQSPPTTSCGAP